MIFWTTFARKGYFQLKTKKVNIPIEFCIFELVQVSSFTWTGHFDFLDQIFPKRVFQVENKKLNITIEFCIFELVYVPSFDFNWQFLFFGPNFRKRVFPVENKKSKHHHWTLHIQIRLGAIFLGAMALLG